MGALPLSPLCALVVALLPLRALVVALPLSPLGALVAAPLAGCASLAAPLRAVEVAPGVFLLPGVRGAVEASTGGRIGNAGFVVGADGVVAIDTGVSYRHGIELLDAIRRVTDKPVRLALITQARQEFVFGAAAFRERGIPIHMQRDAARLMRARCDACLQTLRRTLGEPAMHGSELIVPDVEFDAGHALHAIGRPLRVLHFGVSSGAGDLALLDQRSGTLFAGGLLDVQRVPDVQDGDLAGWRAALAELRRLDLETIVPGHGPASDASAIDAIDGYLRQLEARAAKLLDDGVSLIDVADAAGLPQYEGWDQYAVVHRRNAALVFLRLEQQLLSGAR